MTIYSIQDREGSSCVKCTPIVGSFAQDFTAPAVVKNSAGVLEIVKDFNLRDFTLSGLPTRAICVLFFYPLDFTFVCPTELIALNQRMKEIIQLGAKVIAISVDSQYSHYKYMNTSIEHGGIGPVDFPIVSDITKKISSDYGVLSNTGVAFRGTVILDQHNIVQHVTINNMPIGRNIDEIKRIIEAIQHHETYGDVCPANWSHGKPSMTPTIDDMVAFLGKNYAN